ncbi:hypothetical protein D3C71_1210550 [compost metagenome]
MAVAQRVRRGQQRAHQFRHGGHVHRHPVAVDDNTVGVRLRPLQVQLIDRARVRPFHAQVRRRAIDHGRLNVRHGGVRDLVARVHRGAFHLGEGQRAARQRRVAVRFQEGRGLAAAGLQLDPVVLAAVADLGEGRIAGVGRAHVHDVGGGKLVGQFLDLGAGGVAKLDPAQCAGARARARSLRPFRHVQRAGRQVGLAVGHEHEQAAIGGVVAHQRGALVGHHLHQLVRDAAHAVVLLDGAGAVGVHRHFRHVAVVVRVGLVGVAVNVVAIGLERDRANRRRRVRLVLFAGQVRAPRRQAGAAGDPQPMHRRGVHVAVLDQAELARIGVLRQRQHGDGRRQQAIHVVARLVDRLVFELHHCIDGIARHARHRGGGRQRQQRRAVRTVREKLARLGGHRVVHDGRAGQVEVTAGDGDATLAVGHVVARDEERLVAQLDRALGAIAERQVHRRTHRGAGHQFRVGQRGRGHGRERRRREGHRRGGRLRARVGRRDDRVVIVIA